MSSLRSIILACLLLPLLAARPAAAQDFPPVTDEERAITSVPGEPNAPAVVLFKKGEFLMAGYGRFIGSLSSHLRIQARVKILTEAGKSNGELASATATTSGSRTSRGAPSCRTAGSCRCPRTPSSSAGPRSPRRPSSPPSPSPPSRSAPSSTISTRSPSPPPTCSSPGTSRTSCRCAARRSSTRRARTGEPWSGPARPSPRSVGENGDLRRHRVAGLGGEPAGPPGDPLQPPLRRPGEPDPGAAGRGSQHVAEPAVDLGLDPPRCSAGSMAGSWSTAWA